MYISGSPAELYKHQTHLDMDEEVQLVTDSVVKGEENMEVDKSQVWI